jgi:hypothetical protein
MPESLPDDRKEPARWRAFRCRLPDAVLVVDHFHLVRLANATVTAVRQRVTWDNRNPRGREIDGEWTNRRRLLTGRERLPQAIRGHVDACLDADPAARSSPRGSRRKSSARCSPPPGKAAIATTSRTGSDGSAGLCADANIPGSSYLRWV